MKPIVITAGEPAGVGVDLSVIALNNKQYQNPIVVMGDRDILEHRAQLRGLSFDFADYEDSPQAQRSIWHFPAKSATVGKLQTENAEHVLNLLRVATEQCLKGDFAAMVTAPICKETILASGVAFSGQTEYIADIAGITTPVMLLAGPRLRVALATTHLPLKEVARHITQKRIAQVLRVLNKGLIKLYGLTQPKIVVCGLNPHAGEGGYMGTEEVEHIAPAILQVQNEGICARGPYSADTIIADALIPNADCVLAMYHDQGLPSVKLLDFYETVNVTIGLPFIRVSPDHGVAIDKVGSVDLRFDSMNAAINMAIDANAS